MERPYWLVAISSSAVLAVSGCASKPETVLKPSQITPLPTIQRILPNVSPNIVVNWRIAGPNNLTSGCYEVIFPANQFPRVTANYSDAASKAEYNTQVQVITERISDSDLRYQVMVGQNRARQPESSASVVAHNINFNDKITTKSCYTNWSIDSIEINGQQIGN